jgi:hypothetical protein
MTRTNRQSRPKASRGPDAEKDWTASVAKLQSNSQIVDSAAWAGKIWAGPYGSTIKLLLAKGCKPLPLLQVMEPCSSDWGWLSAKRKKELDDLKERFDASACRLEGAVEDFDVLTWRSLHMGQELFHRYGARAARAADSLRILRTELQPSSTQLRDLRKTQTFFTIGLLWFYCHAACRAATEAKVSNREIADLVNAARQAESDVCGMVTENGVRMVLQRFKKSSPEIYDSTKAWMEQYVADCPDGQQTICEWSLQHPFGQFLFARYGLVEPQLASSGVHLPHSEFNEQDPPQLREFCIEVHSADPAYALRGTARKRPTRQEDNPCQKI